ncbi:hypothetical protein WJX84_008806 [Apatococcus fuscideae]|uniref:Glycerol-3-phosphate dehydrogenase NAD-dependent N-terminal domain-containing protein n=1 Tax=Apatococcus fuscideae TaxID=2026836 RepID=A0AAW1TIW6_9CHLO
MRWSRVLRGRIENGTCPLERIDKVVVFGGGSFGTAMAAVLARQKAELHVILLLRDPYTCLSINHDHTNSRYLEGYELPHNLKATTSISEAIAGAQYAVHALPVQQTRTFLESIKDVLPPDVPLISVSKGLELGSGKMMSEIIPAVLGRKHPAVFLSGPSFAREVMDRRPTGIVAAAKDLRLAREAGAKPATISGLSGLGDIMLTCYGSLSRNRAIGVKLGQGVPLEEILKSSKQVAEGVPTAGVVVGLGRRYKVSLPVLTAVAQVLNSSLRADQAVAEIMNLPQIEER